MVKDNISTLPYGTWPSPLSAAVVAKRAAAPGRLGGIGNLQAAGNRLAWTDLRSTEGGRQALMIWEDGEPREVTPPGWNTRTQVHEYGGAPFTLTEDLILASRWEDQRLYRVSPAEDPVAVTTDPIEPAGVRWADGRVSSDGNWLVAVRESHEEGVIDNEIVALDLSSGAEEVLVTGRDFVSSPRLSPDGTRLAWLAWDHPNMPWDAAELWTARFVNGSIEDPTHRLGGKDASVAAVTWLPDARIVCSEDSSGFWEVYVGDPDGPLEQMSSFGADCGAPAFVFGMSWLAPLPDGRLACILTDRAVRRLVLLDPTTGDSEDVDLPYTVLDRICKFEDGVAMLAASPDGRAAVITWAPEDGVTELVAFEPPDVLRPGDMPTPEAIEAPTPDGEVTHAFLYRPANAEVAADPEERPPLVVFIHGGPTSNVFGVASAEVAFWTTRGFAVADVNYRGSSGFGRAYRNALRERWGELDVMDAIAVANHLAGIGVVDGARMTIRGGSAGGYTTLAVLTTPDHPFTCGTSFFGVADLMSFVEITHKFESHYLDQLVGPLPESADRYRERSPVHRAHLLSRPLLILQGLEDKVVPPSQARQIVTAAAGAGVPYVYLPFEGEQHGFRRAENLVIWHESELAFYGQVMGFEPAGHLPSLTLS
ncbi:MAG TPA: prolyl oligopeptidase family serine peptidase [Acidimicrobiia bacterium]|nr:prolyl oligopeptidase family serine peptidase [Acidimicrobiia bacterium]